MGANVDGLVAGTPLDQEAFSLESLEKRPFLGRLPSATGFELSLLDTATETVWFRTDPVLRLLSIQA